MCGIIGYSGKKMCAPVLLNGLKNLEYRGYDSAGIAYFKNKKISRIRAVGKISELDKIVSTKEVESNTGIGHTRWATHGAPCEENSHPHKSTTGLFYVVHNGIIENSSEIKKTLLSTDIRFESQTDTEVFAHLLEKYYDEKPVAAIAKALAVLKGTYAFGILCKDFPHTVFGAASGSPLVALKCEGGFCLASDISAVEEKFTECYRLYNGEICAFTSDEIRFYDAGGEEISKKAEEVFCKESSISKDGYPHYMLKEIAEQPKAIRDTIASLVSMDSIELPDVNFDEEFLQERLENIIIVACGSAYHTGLVAKHLLESLADIPCQVEIASEFRYSHHHFGEETLAVFVSQSGETADTLAALRLVKKYGSQVLSIVNVQDSIIAKESENAIFTKAGKEVAVATTKAYSAQLVAFYTLAIFLGRAKGKISVEEEEKLVKELLLLPEKVKETLEATNEIAKNIAGEICKQQDVFFLGRLKDFATACEGALKLKEISYINAQSYAAGELKHGTISLIENGTPIVAVAGESKIFSKTLSNICEVEARGGKVFVVTDKAKQTLVSSGRTVVAVSDICSYFRPSLLVLPLQLISYYTALLRGCDIDKPKNLAKSVTVE
jgi:glucosamine--fructose-6-phosphate aminotransferase (isomerizing)